MKSPESMKDLLAKYGGKLIPIKAGELFEVKILQVLKNRLLVDVGGFALGYIPEQEFSPDVDTLKVGDKVLAYVLTVENDDGYVILSLRRADKERISKILATKFETGDILQVKTTSANKGGLLCQFGDFEGFLPVSQLASSHYPKVSSGDREEIFSRLKELVGQTFQVKVLSFEPASGKLIFSEKAAGDVVQQEKIKKLKVGQKFTAEITGIVNFGLFVKLQIPDSSDIEGLVHISEASWDHIVDLSEQFKIGQKVEVSVISIENNRVSLSIKRLLPDPWLKAAADYKVGQIVEGKVTKITPYGAFIQVGQLDALVHISELGEKISNPKDVIEEGKSYQFKIISVEPEVHKLSLSLKAVEKKETKKRAKKTAGPKHKKTK
ncbi:MAG: S1 RNA-binding domain-containing protein [Patescibacteria group bacterium]